MGLGNLKYMLHYDTLSGRRVRAAVSGVFGPKQVPAAYMPPGIVSGALAGVGVFAVMTASRKGGGVM